MNTPKNGPKSPDRKDSLNVQDIKDSHEVGLAIKGLKDEVYDRIQLTSSVELISDDRGKLDEADKLRRSGKFENAKDIYQTLQGSKDKYVSAYARFGLGCIMMEASKLNEYEQEKFNAVQSTSIPVVHYHGNGLASFLRDAMDPYKNHATFCRSCSSGRPCDSYYATPTRFFGVDSLLGSRNEPDNVKYHGRVVVYMGDHFVDRIEGKSSLSQETAHFFEKLAPEMPDALGFLKSTLNAAHCLERVFKYDEAIALLRNALKKVDARDVEGKEELANVRRGLVSLLAYWDTGKDKSKEIDELVKLLKHDGININPEEITPANKKTREEVELFKKYPKHTDRLSHTIREKMPHLDKKPLEFVYKGRPF